MYIIEDRDQELPENGYQRQLRELIDRVESNHFRTDQDTGASNNALLIWNIVRADAGLSRLKLDHLPTWCEGHKVYHAGGGCKVKEPKAV